MSNFHPLEVVGRGSETQLQVGENLNWYKLAGKRLTKTMVSDSDVFMSVQKLPQMKQCVPLSRKNIQTCEGIQ